MYRMYGMWVVAWMPRNLQIYRMCGMPWAHGEGMDARSRAPQERQTRSKAGFLPAFGMTKSAAKPSLQAGMTNQSETIVYPIRLALGQVKIYLKTVT